MDVAINMISRDFNITINTCLTNFYVLNDTSIYKIYVVKFVIWHKFLFLDTF